MPEWLSGMTRNHVGSARAGSNPAEHVVLFVWTLHVCLNFLCTFRLLFPAMPSFSSRIGAQLLNFSSFMYFGVVFPAHPAPEHLPQIMSTSFTSHSRLLYLTSIYNTP
uniref:Uncharacterized protein n=1 Tax=Physcomitrium patens TaxID=3218 RepID=A0A2K1L9C0_PHYPA|nr:hypothetical protein PHYPA_001062 [Physcomitrium patens]